MHEVSSFLLLRNSEEGNSSGTAGAGLAVTATVFNDVSNIEFDLRAAVLRVTYGTPDKTANLDFSLMATASFTLVTGVSVVATVSS